MYTDCCVEKVWSFAPPPEDDISLSASPSPYARGNGNITPYQDPVYGDRPSYHAGPSSSRLKEIQQMGQQQDEIMTDVYSADTENVGQGYSLEGTEEEHR